RGGEAARRRRVGTTPAGQDVPVPIVDAHATVLRGLRRPVPPGNLPGVPPELGDISAALAVEHDVGRALGVPPFGEVLAVGAEDLDPIVLPVADEDAPVGGGGDAVRQVELAGSDAGDTPGLFELTGRREPVHPAVAVPVGDVEIAPGPDGD